jgi:hypothetical protein
MMVLYVIGIVAIKVLCIILIQLFLISLNTEKFRRVEENSEQEPQVKNVICVTTNYNLGRIYEGLFLCDKACREEL